MLYPNTGSVELAFNDEKYWHTIRQLFPLSKDFIDLNNGTMGPSLYPVIEAVKKGMMDGDQLGSYFIHKGVDAFQLFYENNSWKIIQVCDTRRR